jgi:DNA-binding transcriptional LysR family regulator
VDRLLSIVHHVSAGVAIGILPSGCIPPIRWGEGFHSAVLVEPSLTVTVGLITSRSRYMTPAASGLASLLKEQISTKLAK